MTLRFTKKAESFSLIIVLDNHKKNGIIIMQIKQPQHTNTI